MLIAQYFVEFIFYSFLGWLWESFYCTLKERRWQDRGFLFGPVCPIYGASVVAASVLFRFVPVISSPDLPLWQMFLICMAGSAVAEFGTSWVLEKRFHARWWDYSNIPLNIQGRICLPVSLAFGAAGVVIVKFLLPLMTQAHTAFPALGYEGLALGFAILFGADFALTEASLSALLTEIESFHSEFNEKAESTYERITQAPKHLEENLEERKQRIAAAAARHASGLSSGSRRMLRNIVSFRPASGIPARRVSDMGAGEHLKEALRRIEEKKDGDEKGKKL
jgi:uncharacterized membrane protein